MTSAVINLTCPKCGGGVQGATPGSVAKCSYCGTELHVPTIGGSASAQGERACPRCNVAMFEGRRGNFVLHGCGLCGGVWLDNAASQRVSSRFEPDAVALANAAAQSAQVHPHQGMPASCPVCHVEMNTVMVGGTAIEVDVCADHGTWFDRYELQQLSQMMGQQYPANPEPASYQYQQPQYVQQGPSIGETFVQATVSGAGVAAGYVAAEAVFDLLGGLLSDS